jgi:WhiB family redox-sensing transcriptional regulator
MDEDWRVRARCGTENAEVLFRPGAYQRQAKLFCLPCPVRAECLGWAMDHHVEEGVWGGMTERERRAARLRNPDVVDWSKMLIKARDDWADGQRSQTVTNGPDERGSVAG